MFTPLRLLVLLAGLSLASCAGPSPAHEPVPGRPDRPHWNLDRNALALAGYDPVAYFLEGGAGAHRGRTDLVVQHLGVTYRFVSPANRLLFLQDPGKYEPAYGGWCAYAMAKGDKVRVHPHSYLIQGGRLMLFYDGLFADTRKSWSKSPQELEVRAETGWEALLADD